MAFLRVFGRIASGRVPALEIKFAERFIAKLLMMRAAISRSSYCQSAGWVSAA